MSGNKAAAEADGHTHETSCLNCGTPLVGGYCHGCGQHAHVHTSLGAFGHDLLHGVLHFEGKIWRTLPMLAWRPGDLTRRYIAGERARFVSPLALFLFSIFLLFAVAAFTVAGSPDFSDVQSGLQTQHRQLEAQQSRLESRRAEAVMAGRPVEEIDRQISDTRSQIAAIHAVQTGDLAAAASVSSSTARSTRQKDRIGDAIQVNTTRGAQLVIPDWVDQAYRKAKQNPDLLFYKIKTDAYKFSWALIPLSVPFLWLLFPFSRRFRLYHHTVFVTYSLSFMTLLLVAALLISSAGMRPVGGLALLLPPIHMYRQLRGAYLLGWFAALWRTVLLLFFAIVAMMLFILGMIVMGAV